jgi:IS4 transposase
MRIADVTLTDDSEGETLKRHSVDPEEVILADRGYGTRSGIGSLLRRRGHLVVRIHWRNVPLETRGGKALDTLALLRTLTSHEIGDWSVQLRDGRRCFPLRLVAIKKSQAAANKERKHLRRAAQKQGHKVGRRSMEAAAYTYVLTNLPPSEVSALEILQLYRLRWQVELAFKRLKSLLHVHHLRAKKPDLARTYLLANILGALIIEELSVSALSFSPWGFRLPTTPGQLVACV